jgi:SAM-dependent methyltransferase
MRAMVGTTDPSLFDNPTGGPVFPGLAPGSYPTVLDFGCGCGRLARQLVQQRPRPVRYVGVDLHPGMVKWCSDNLSPRAPGFEFHHHDVRYDGFNPGADKPMHAPLPVGDHEFSLVTAISVFTHLTESQTEPYLREMARVLAPGGTFLSSWFLFDKRDFPMMQPEQNTLFINEWDVRNAVIYDSRWVRERAAEVGLVLVHASPPEVRGHQWTLMLRPAGPGVQEVELPDDDADRGRRPPPAMPSGAPEIGL